MITVSGSGANAGFVNFYEEVIFASDCSTISPKPDCFLDTRFTYYFMKCAEPFITSELRRGAAQPHVYPKDLKTLKIPVPPLAEQERIVGILDEAFEGIAAATAQAEKNLHNARELFQSVLQSTFSQKGDDWVETTLGEALDEIRNGLNCKQNKDKVGTPISRIETISSAVVDYERVGYSEITQQQRDKFILKRGDILFSHINSAIHVGKTAIVESEDELVHGVNLLRFRSKPIVSPPFLNSYLRSIFHGGYWQRVCKQSINQASVNQTDIKAVPFSYPPLPTQQAIVEKLDALSEETKALEAIYERKQSALAELKQSLLQKAFAGEL